MTESWPFFGAAIIVAVFGFSGIAPGALGFMGVCFVVFVVAFVVSLIMGSGTRPPPVNDMDDRQQLQV